MSMTRFFRGTLAALMLPLAAVAADRSAADADIRIPFQKFVLDNGLTLIVHEDHKAPIVSVNVWYHVGSKNEKPGRTGFAHLFEHLMFNGSEHFDDDYFQAVERVGATDLNGTTNEDRTNYFQNAPKSALDLILWLESDRMGHLLGAVTQARLDEQRGVVQNEKRQSENEPYAMAEEMIARACFPAGHPYSWTVIGSMADLNAAKLEDVHDWFKTYYGAANAVIAIAGDVDAATARRKVEQYFGSIAAGPPLARHQAWIAPRTGVHRQKAQDRVPQARLYKVWNVPQFGTLDADYLELVAGVLASGKTSRLYKRLVYDDQIASSVTASLEQREIAGLFQIVATVRPGVEVALVEAALDQELARFLASGPTAKELERVKTEHRAGFIRGIERIGGFGGKSDILARSQVFKGEPEFYRVPLKRVADATAVDLQHSAQQWLSDGVYVLEIHPFPTFTSAGPDVDRSRPPAPGVPPDAAFPVMQRATLSNGLKIILAERHAVPVVEFGLLVNAGYAADQFARPGTAKLAMAMLDEGTRKRSSLEISESLALLGATLGAGSDLDSSSVRLSALKARLDAALEIFTDVILNPSFPPADFDRLKKQQLDAIQRERSEPVSMGLRVFPGLLYGRDHAYANSFTGTGTEASVSAITRDDVITFHRTWFKASNAALIVVGDTTLKEITPRLERLFRGWAGGEVPRKNIGTVPRAARSVVYLVDRPGSIQSVIFAGDVVPPKANPEEIAIETLNNLLGGQFTSRLNLNLREDKHWTYGAGSLIVDARGQRPFIAFAPVQTDKTKESMGEILKELRGIRGDRPVAADELAKAKDNQTLQLPGAWETMDAVAESIGQLVRFGLPEDYFQTYAPRVRALSLEQMGAAVRTVINPENLVWVVVGDRAKIEPGIRELNLGEIRIIDVDGNPAK